MENSNFNAETEMRKKYQFPNEQNNLVSGGNSQIMNDPFKQYINSLQNNAVHNSEKNPNAENNHNNNNENNFPSLEQIESASGFNAKPSLDNLTQNYPINNNIENNVHDFKNYEKKFMDINSDANNNLNFNEQSNFINNHNYENIANRRQTETKYQNPPVPIGITAELAEPAYSNPNLYNKHLMESKQYGEDFGNLGEPGLYDGDRSIKGDSNNSFKKKDIYNYNNNNYNNNNYNNDLKPNIEMNLFNKANADNLNASPINDENKYDPNINYDNNQMVMEPVNNIPLPVVECPREPVITDSTIESVNQKMCVIYCIYHWLIFALCATVTVLFFILQSNIKYSEGYFYRDIYKSWNQNLLSSIYTNNCQNRNDNLFQEEWPGTLAGCNCYTSIRVGSCGRRSPCTNIKAKSAIPFNFWRGMSFCRKIENNWQNKTYFDLDVRANSADCAVGSRSCGIVDSIGNHLCVDNGRACPINFIKFYDKYDFETKIKNVITSDDNVINASNGVLVFSNKNLNNQKIPVDFEISNGQPCLNPFYKNVGSVYVLDPYAQRNYCLKFTDYNDNKNNGTTPISGQFFFNNNYQEIDKISMENLYIENGITQITYNLPLFPKESYNRDISLYARNYFGLKISCFNNIKKNNMAKDLIDDLKVISNLVETDSTGLVVVIILMISFVFVLVINGMVFTSKTKKSNKLIKVDRCIFWVYLVFAIIALAFILSIFILLAVLLSNIRFTPTFDLVFNDPNCIDSFGLELYQQLIPNISFVRKSAVASIIMSVIAFIMIIIYSCIGYFKTEESLYI